MVALLERLVSAESPSLDPAAQREPYRLLAEGLGELGFEVEPIPGREVGDHLLARDAAATTANGAPQLLLGHMDTVWPQDTLAKMPVREEEGRLHGPGVYDMKAGLVQMLFALRALREHDVEPASPVTVLINTDEEIGSPESREHIERLARSASRAFVLEPSFGPAGNLKTARKGSGDFTVTVHGLASHAGIEPGKGVSAILELSHQVQELFELNDPERGITVNVGTIDGGLRPNVIAPRAVARVDVRVRTAEDAERVEAAVRGLEPVQEGASIEVEGGFGRPPLERTARNRALWEAARDAAEALGIRLDEAAVGGASDGNFSSRHAATLDGLGGVGDGAHAEHEHVLVERLPERAALLATLLCA
ncbi:MAG: M20 family metallopeptidase [Solirubrobacterales bacterium]